MRFATDGEEKFAELLKTFDRGGGMFSIVVENKFAVRHGRVG
jgi:hypothetical protein